MYVPEHFAETRPDVLARFICTHPLGVLITHGSLGLDANHIPFEFDAQAGEQGVLRAHVARANPVWQTCPSGSSVLVVFRAADAYVSPNWYPSKHETHREVPTWNYEAVHAHGAMTVREDERFLRGVLARLTRRFEASEPKAWKMGDAAPGVIDALLRQIVGIEITVTTLIGKRKLSQNKADRDRLGAAAVLQAHGHDALARRMRED